MSAPQAHTGSPTRGGLVRSFLLPAALESATMETLNVCFLRIIGFLTRKLVMWDRWQDGGEPSDSHQCQVNREAVWSTDLCDAAAGKQTTADSRVMIASANVGQTLHRVGINPEYVVCDRDSLSSVPDRWQK